MRRCARSARSATTRAIAALTEQLAFYKKGEGAWSALDALARIGAPASVPRLQGAAAGQGSVHPPRRRRRARPRRRHRVDRRARAKRQRPTNRRWCGWRRRSRCRSSDATTPARIVDLMSSPKVHRAGTGIPRRARALDRADASCRGCRIPTPTLREALADVLGVDRRRVGRSPRARGGGEGSRTRRSRRREARRSRAVGAAVEARCLVGERLTRSDPHARFLRPSDARRRARSDRQGPGARDARAASRPASSSRPRPTSARAIPPATPRPGRRRATRRSTDRPASPTST